MVKTINAPNLRYIHTAKKAGCPREQLVNFRRINYVAQPRQLLYHAACRETDAADGPIIIGFGGARGPGKSHASLAQVTDDCLRFPGLKVLFLRNIGKAAKESFKDLVKRVLKTEPHLYVESKGQLSFPNGSLVIVGGFKDEGDIDSYLGIEYDVIVVEEATLLTKKKRDMLQGSLRSSKDGWRPRIYFTTNPGGVGHAWFKKELIEPYRRGTQTNTRFIPSVASDNLLIDQTYHDYLAGLDGWLGRAWRDGDWDIASGQYFVNFKRSAHVISNIKPQRHWEYWISMDYGYVHWNTVYLMAKDGDGNVMALDELAHRKQTPAEIAPDIIDMLTRWKLRKSDIKKFVAGGDVFAERGGEDTVAKKYENFGFKITRADMSRISGAMEIATRLGNPQKGKTPTLFINSKCHKLGHILPLLQHDPNRPEDVLKVDTDEDGDGGDDPYDGFRYGVMEAQKSTGRGWTGSAYQ